MTPKFQAGDLVATNAECVMPTYGYVLSSTIEAEAILYLLRTNKDRETWFGEESLRLVGCLFCPLPLKWLIGKHGF